MQFTINNQTVNIHKDRTDVTIHHPVEHGGDKKASYPFSILDKPSMQSFEVTCRNYAESYWLKTLAMQIRQITDSAKQLELFA